MESTEHREVSVLVVEDDEVNQMAIRRGFDRQRVANELFFARDGIEALEMLRGENGREPIPPPYLILLDLKMPRMNGIEFLQELRKDPDHHRAVVFILTTSKDDQDKLSAYDQHVAGYIVKSNISKEFVELVGLLDLYWKVVELPTGKEIATCPA